MSIGIMGMIYEKLDAIDMTIIIQSCASSGLYWLHSKLVPAQCHVHAAPLHSESLTCIQIHGRAGL